MGSLFYRHSSCSCAPRCDVEPRTSRRPCLFPPFIRLSSPLHFLSSSVSSSNVKLIHYPLPSSSWDEWVPASRLLKLTEANLATQKSLQQANPGNIHGGSTASKTQNKSAAGGNKDNISTRAVTRKDGTRGTKRAREEVRMDTRGFLFLRPFCPAGLFLFAVTDTPCSSLTQDDSNKKPDMKLNVPEVLKMYLVDDWEAVTKNNQVRARRTREALC